MRHGEHLGGDAGLPAEAEARAQRGQKVRPHARHIDPPQDAPARPAVHPRKLEQRGVGAADAGADVAPHDGQHHEQRDEHRQPVARDPDEREHDERRHRRGLDDRHERAQQRVGGFRYRARGGQRHAEHDRPRHAEQHTADGHGRDAPERPGRGKLTQPAHDRPRRGQQQLPVHEQRQRRPHGKPERERQRAAGKALHFSTQ